MKYTKLWKHSHRFVDADTKNFKLIFFAFLIGGIVGLIASLFRYLLDRIEEFRTALYSMHADSPFYTWGLALAFGIIGIGASLYLVRRFAPETSGSGVHEIEGALDDLRPVRWKRVLPVKFFASLFSLGSGLLLGREGPTIQIGSSIGRMVKDVFRQEEEKSNPLVSAGAAAGLASAFNAPFSGIIFVMEEMHGHFRYSFFSLAAIMVASGTADFVSRFLVGASPVIKMTVFTSPSLSTIWLFILLGAIFSIIGFTFNKLLILSLDFFASLSRNATIMSAVIAGIIISSVGILYPNLIGGGYNTIRLAIDQSFSLQFLLLLFIGRFFLSIFSYGIGAPGGIFAPLLALGVVIGMLFGSIAQHYFPDLITNPVIFAVAGMAGIFASTVRAPITGLMLAVEMTSNFELILPLIFTTVTAALITTQMGNQPIYTVLLERTLKRNQHD
jgi:CIC family chloride channel protein